MSDWTQWTIPLYQAVIIGLFILAIWFLWEITCILRERVPKLEPTSFQITQIGAKGMPTNNEITAGQTGVFELTNLVPTGSAFAVGVLPAWTSSDPSVVLSAPSGITDGSQIAAAVPATDTAANFVLTASYTRKADGVVVTANVTVTIVPVAPPPTPEPTGFSIQQLS